MYIFGITFCFFCDRGKLKNELAYHQEEQSQAFDFYFTRALFFKERGLCYDNSVGFILYSYILGTQIHNPIPR